MSKASSLAESRQQRGWSQARLADESQVSRTEISAIETGRLVPSVAVALRLASTLGTSVETLFGGGSPQSASMPLAWAASSVEDPRLWRATVHGRLLAYPVESTAAGVIPHDALVTKRGIEVVSQSAQPDRTLVIAGCDPLVGLLVQGMAEQHGVRVLPMLRSSSQALDLLKAGLVHAAGIHLTNPSGKPANDAAVSARLGPGYCLIHQLRWEEGIALGSQRRERSAGALLRANVRWVNREEGSAARQSFDTLLGSRRPKGYTHVVRDHRAVAATVSSGWAEAGVCIRPAAAEARLSFIALHRESYELCVAEALLDDPRIVALSATLKSIRYRQFVAHVPGCESSDAGAQRVVA